MGTDRQGMLAHRYAISRPAELKVLHREQLSRVPANSGEIVHTFDQFDVSSFCGVAAGFGQDRFGYVVTPNVDHLVRYHEDPAFRAAYQRAAFVLLDSRFVAYLLRLSRGIKLPVCTGADLTAALFSHVIEPSDRIVLIGGSAQQADRIASTYRLANLRHHDPPMGFLNNAHDVEKCLRFIEGASPFRFCFLSVGSPQQEALARLLRLRGVARGLALCVGAALNFIGGSEKRAPVWMQRLALEWLYRLMHDPRRLAHRYLVRDPRIFRYLRHTKIVMRTATDDGMVSRRPRSDRIRLES